MAEESLPAPETPQTCADVVTLVDKYEIRVFRPSSYRFDPRTVILPDDFYEPTLSDVKLASASLSSRVQTLESAPLMTKKMREAQEQARMSRFRKVLIRVLLPDRYAIQGVFRPQSTISDVQDFVKACLNESVRFHLFTVPPKVVLKDLRATLWNQKMVPAAQIYLGLDDGPSDSSKLLKEQIFTLAEEPPTPQLPKPPVSETFPAPKPQPKASSSETVDPSKGKARRIPKWLKPGK